MEGGVVVGGEGEGVEEGEGEEVCDFGEGEGVGRVGGGGREVMEGEGGGKGEEQLLAVLLMVILAVALFAFFVAAAATAVIVAAAAAVAAVAAIQRKLVNDAPLLSFFCRRFLKGCHEGVEDSAEVGGMEVFHVGRGKEKALISERVLYF